MVDIGGAYNALKKRIIAMKIGKSKLVYRSDDGTKIKVTKPSKVTAQLKNSKRYDPERNFQISFVKKGKKEFLPNHIRLLMDLYLKRDESPRKAKALFDAIEEIYNGKNPKNYRAKLKQVRFKRQIETPFTNLCMAQLFMLEQDINYSFGKVQPPRAYLMGYIRMIQQDAEEIDKLIWSSTRHPPRKGFRE